MQMMHFDLYVFLNQSDQEGSSLQGDFATFSPTLTQEGLKVLACQPR